eukprot:13575259-Heterocapsa_arctica.AAC.1
MAPPVPPTPRTVQKSRMPVRVRGCQSEVEKTGRSGECQLAFEKVKQKSRMLVTVLDPRFGD